MEIFTEILIQKLSLVWREFTIEKNVEGIESHNSTIGEEVNRERKQQS